MFFLFFGGSGVRGQRHYGLKHKINHACSNERHGLLNGMYVMGK